MQGEEGELLLAALKECPPTVRSLSSELSLLFAFSPLWLSRSFAGEFPIIYRNEKFKNKIEALIK